MTLARAFAAVLLTCACTGAFAQNANQEAKDLAQRLGRERSIEGLEAIVKARNGELLGWYERGWRATSQRDQGVPVPEAIEALIVKHYRDPEVGPELRTLVSANWTPYRTRALFDLMLEEWRSGKERPVTYPIREGIFNTSQPGIEPPVLAWLAQTPAPGEYDANAIMRFLSQRKHAPAVPVLAARLKALPPGGGQAVADWILSIHTAEAVRVVLERLAWLRERSGGVDERAYIAERITRLPREVPLDLDAFRAALGPGTLDDPRYGAVARMLADPRRHYAQISAQERERELVRKRAELAKPVEEARAVIDTQPQRYVQAMQAFLEASTRLAAEYHDAGTRGIEQDISRGWLSLGHFARFRERDPRTAVEFYAKAEGAGHPLAIFAQADTWQFDLRDNPRAVAEYRRNLAKLPAADANTERNEAAFIEWSRRWLAAQLAFLETGRTFTGSIGRDDIEGAATLIYVGSAAAGLNEELGAISPARLPALPPSGWVLLRTSTMVGDLPDARSVLAYLAKHDPAGYASACLFGLASELARREGADPGGRTGSLASGVMREAGARFLAQRRITLQPSPFPR